MSQSATERLFREVLDAHRIARSNPSQVACRACGLWMQNDVYREHLAVLLAAALPPDPLTSQREPV